MSRSMKQVAGGGSRASDRGLRGYPGALVGSGRRAAGRALGLVVLAAAVIASAGCETGPQLDTRTFEVQYLASYQVSNLIAPYVFTDREGSPGMMSTAEGAVTVRETPDNLDKIARVLAEYDRPRPTIMLNFQIIEANGPGGENAAIADVERELRRLFRFEGYRLLAETQVAAIQGTGVRQAVGADDGQEVFLIQTGVTEVRTAGEARTLTLDVGLFAEAVGNILETSVTIPAGHSVVLGTARSPVYDGALILVVRAEVVESGM